MSTINCSGSNCSRQYKIEDLQKSEGRCTNANCNKDLSSILRSNRTRTWQLEQSTQDFYPPVPVQHNAPSPGATQPQQMVMEENAQREFGGSQARNTLGGEMLRDSPGPYPSRLSHASHTSLSTGYIQDDSTDWQPATTEQASSGNRNPDSSESAQSYRPSSHDPPAHKDQRTHHDRPSSSRSSGRDAKKPRQ